jgi:ketosteroid isomerase-like protein
MPRADRATIHLLTDYFDAMEVKDFDRLGDYYAENITQTFANASTITGREAVLARMVDLLGKVASLAHPLINVWQEDGGVIIFEVTSVWRFRDDTVTKTTRARSSPSSTAGSPISASTSTTLPSTACSSRPRVRGQLDRRSRSRVTRPSDSQLRRPALPSEHVQVDDAVLDPVRDCRGT